LLDYFERIGDAAGIPLIVQDAPQLTGVAMAPTLWARMAERIPSFRYIKVEGTPQGHTISEALRLCGDRLGVFCGWGGLSILDALERGSIGSMPAGNFTREFAGIQAAWEAGDRAEAERLFDAAIPFVLWTMQSIDFSVATTKEEFRRRGIFTSNHQRGRRSASTTCRAVSSPDSSTPASEQRRPLLAHRADGHRRPVDRCRGERAEACFE
jgi:4-hydroxy-tetrahydrodipicolinate synthase